MNNLTNQSEQCEEIEALNSIYIEDWKEESEINSYSMQITKDIKLFITLSPDYPSSCAPKFELLAPVLNLQQKHYIFEEFHKIYEENKGSPILFQWIERLKEIVNEIVDVKSDFQTDTDEVIEEKTNAPKKEIPLRITHGDIIQDRKSTFQGHASEVRSQEDTQIFMKHLLENKKIAQATHNIAAYRILTPKGTILQDCDDDGEAHAGKRVLHLLQILNLSNVMVVVSRWYGGIHLGPDRFKHINNAARQVLIQGGFIPS